MMKKHHSHSYPLLSALLFFFFVCWSSSGSLLSIWLHQEVGLKPGDTGIIYAVLSVSALFAQVCYGFIQDKLGLRKNLLWYITVLLILSGPAFLLFGYLLKINVLLGSIFGGIYIGLTFNGGIGVLESYTERVARQSQFEFGQGADVGLAGLGSRDVLCRFTLQHQPKTQLCGGQLLRAGIFHFAGAAAGFLRLAGDGRSGGGR